MGISAVKVALDKLPYDIKEVDLIVGASYSPFDTVATLAHVVQEAFQIPDTRCVYISSACSSFINAMEIVEGYFATGKASKALVVVSEHNTAYSHETDEKSGHLWGDGAAAIFISRDSVGKNEGKIVASMTRGLGNVGKASEAVYLHPRNGGLMMPHGKDVFTHACKYMTEALLDILNKNSIPLVSLTYLIPHQANMRIIKYLACELNFDEEKIITNIQELGNTGSASTLIALSQNMHRLKPDDLVAFTVFGGGYSSGSMLIRF
jgi:3-oxoacyl-[acyl-carrier-protein] synthase-3